MFLLFSKLIPCPLLLQDEDGRRESVAEEEYY